MVFLRARKYPLIQADTERKGRDGASIIRAEAALTSWRNAAETGAAHESIKAHEARPSRKEKTIHFSTEARALSECPRAHSSEKDLVAQSDTPVEDTAANTR